jgi:colanic acid/amylovoran biosynthesis glycosyltransferase
MPWMRRQIEGMRSLNAQIVCWLYHATTNHPLTNTSVHTLYDVDRQPYYDGRMRWLYRLYNVGSGNFYRVLGSERRALIKLIQGVRPSSILCHDGDIALRLVDVARLLQVPVVAYFHGDFRFYRNRWYRRSLETRLKQFAAVIVVTEQERAWMRDHGVPDSNLHVIPVGAPTDLFLPKADKTHEGVRFVMAYRLAEEKGCKESVSAFANVASQRSDVFLEIYGDGPERPSLEKMARTLGLEHIVKFHGVVDEQVLATALPECDVFIQHSLGREGAPVAIVEAMSCGLPVVATDVGGIIDQVVENSTGFIVNQRDVPAMTRAMLLLAGDESLRKTLGQNGRKRAVEFFDSSLLNRRLQQVLIEAGRV